MMIFKSDKKIIKSVGCSELADLEEELVVLMLEVLSIALPFSFLELEFVTEDAFLVKFTFKVFFSLLTLKVLALGWANCFIGGLQLFFMRKKGIGLRV